VPKDNLHVRVTVTVAHGQPSPRCFLWRLPGCDYLFHAGGWLRARSQPVPDNCGGKPTTPTEALMQHPADPPTPLSTTLNQTVTS
jgi:hypothetical protein